VLAAGYGENIEVAENRRPFDAYIELPLVCRAPQRLGKLERDFVLAGRDGETIAWDCRREPVTLALVERVIVCAGDGRRRSALRAANETPAARDEGLVSGPHAPIPQIGMVAAATVDALFVAILGRRRRRAGKCQQADEEYQEREVSDAHESSFQEANAKRAGWIL